MMDIAVVTTLNEELSIGPLVSALRGQGLRVCVVDDASDDETPYCARHAGAHVISHVLRRGIGPSLVEGWRWALGEGALRVVQLDAGGSHFAGQALDLLGGLDTAAAAYSTSGADLVIGSRFCAGARYEGNVRRMVLSRAAALACNVRYGGGLTVRRRTVSPGNGHALTGVSDWTSGYRAFSAAALRKLARMEYRATMHGWQIEVLLAARWLGLRVIERPITYRAGRSSFNRKIAKEAFGVWNSQRFVLRS
jgi:glycosyltransferase involved in cell wall biosynthesis